MGAVHRGNNTAVTHTPSKSADPKPSRKRRLLRWGLEIAVVLVIYLAISTFRDRDSLPTGGESVAPPFALRNLDGTLSRSSDFEGKTLLLHFWATWCGVCRTEIPTMKAVHEGLDDDEVLLSIVSSSDVEEVRAFVEENELPYPVLFADRDVLNAYGISAFPTNYVIDSAGKISAHTVGLTTRFGLRSRMGCAR